MTGPNPYDKNRNTPIPRAPQARWWHRFQHPARAAIASPSARRPWANWLLGLGSLLAVVCAYLIYLTHPANVHLWLGLAISLLLAYLGWRFGRTVERRLWTLFFALSGVLLSTYALPAGLFFSVAGTIAGTDFALGSAQKPPLWPIIVTMGLVVVAIVINRRA